ncbi:MAG TPA: hypothetical protein VHC47_07485 [Mucilaginibacter sp.]|nr:hypothetical protein [Mucilaginibacter sp.]
MLSSFKPKTKTEKLVFGELKSLPEIKDFYAAVKAKGDKPDITINPPDSSFKVYRFQIGVSYPDIFRTYFWLAIDPKSLQVYYEDFDDEGIQDITLQQWRYWRKRPKFQKLHKWVNGKIVVLEDKPHAKKKSR